MTTALIIIFVVLAMLSPLTWLRPSKRETRTSLVRKAVIADGMRVDLKAAPLSDAPKGIVGYRRPWPTERDVTPFILVHDEWASDALREAVSGYRWREESRLAEDPDFAAALEHLTRALPEDALMLESSLSGLTLWWGESLALEDCVAWRREFEALHALLIAKAPIAHRRRPLVGTEPRMPGG
ncbi:preprotein translocase subunit YajC [Cobetia marina]|uniref:Preprotein translocase subunit YajC n=1 Tax=Cobetia marina TaxID=28258 RepID=A0ABU9GKH0_COBMA